MSAGRSRLRGRGPSPRRASRRPCPSRPGRSARRAAGSRPRRRPRRPARAGSPGRWPRRSRPRRHCPDDQDRVGNHAPLEVGQGDRCQHRYEDEAERQLGRDRREYDRRGGKCDPDRQLDQRVTRRDARRAAPAVAPEQRARRSPERCRRRRSGVPQEGHSERGPTIERPAVRDERRRRRSCPATIPPRNANEAIGTIGSFRRLARGFSPRRGRASEGQRRLALHLEPAVEARLVVHELQAAARVPLPPPGSPGRAGCRARGSWGG